MATYSMQTDEYIDMSVRSVAGDGGKVMPYVVLSIECSHKVHGGVQRIKLSLNDVDKLRYYLTECLKDVAIINV